MTDKSRALAHYRDMAAELMSEHDKTYIPPRSDELRVELELDFGAMGRLPVTVGFDTRFHCVAWVTIGAQYEMNLEFRELTEEARATIEAECLEAHARELLAQANGDDWRDEAKIMDRNEALAINRRF